MVLYFTKVEDFFCPVSGVAFSGASFLLNHWLMDCLPETVGTLVERARTSRVNRWLALPDYRLGYRSATISSNRLSYAAVR